MSTRAASLALLCVVLALAARADDAPLARLFPREAEITVEGTGLARLVLPVEVLLELRPDLSDLRVFDAAGREVPFFLDPGATSTTAATQVEREAAHVVSVERDVTTPERELPRVRERYVLSPPETVAGDLHEIELEISAAAPEFVRTVRVGELEPAPLFRLSPQSQRTRVALPPPGHDVEVVIEGRERFYLEPEFAWRFAARPKPAPRAEVPLVELSRTSEHGVSTLELARPPGLVPTALRFSTPAASFVRAVEVDDLRTGAEASLGRGTIFRAPLAVVVEEVEVPLSGRAVGDRLRVALQDRDSPPLDALATAAVVVQPTLVMALAPGVDGGPAGVLRFGGGRATRPRYDLADLWDVLEKSAEHRDALQALSPDAVAGAQARLGPVRPNPSFDAAPALAFAMRAGATLDARTFERRRKLRVPGSAQGSVRVALDAQDVAAARADLADVRVIDSDGAQWPYLLERDAVRAWLELPAERRSARGASRYALALPASPLRIDRIEISPEVGFIQREYTLEASDASGRKRTLANGRLELRADAPRPLELGFGAAQVASLELEVRDGDEAPLELARVRARVLLPELVLVAPVGDYTLLLGYPDEESPEYALADVRDVVLAVASERAEAGALEPNPVFKASARLTSGARAESRLQSALVWAALLGAVAILALVTLRVARAEPQ